MSAPTMMAMSPPTSMMVNKPATRIDSRMPMAAISGHGDNDDGIGQMQRAAGQRHHVAGRAETDGGG